MADDIRIIAWPEDDLAMQHRFDPQSPVPVTVGFDDSSVKVAVESGEKPVSVDMQMDLRAAKPVPLCVSICEPICAKSEYTIAFDIFDQPVGRIVVRGLTRLFNCRDGDGDPAPDPGPAQEVCTDFRRRKPGETFAEPVEIGGATFAPVEGELTLIDWGAPEGRTKMLFTSAGVRITLPEPSDSAAITLINYFGQSLNVAVLKDGAEVSTSVENVGTNPRRVTVTHPGMTGLIVSGGGNEAAIVELCWTPSSGPAVAATTLTTRSPISRA